LGLAEIAFGSDNISANNRSAQYTVQFIEL